MVALLVGQIVEQTRGAVHVAAVGDRRLGRRGRGRSPCGWRGRGQIS